MSARLLATLCLAFCCVPVSSAQPAAPRDVELVVYLRTGGNQPAAPLSHMKRELSELMHQAGYRLEWRSLDGDRGADADAPFLAVLELTGVCGLASGYPAADRSAATSASLATTSVTDGQVLPFSALNCAALTRSVSASLSAEAGARRDFLYGRAMARVVAHEFYHVLMRTAVHARSGIARSCFTSEDLLTERFEFEGATLAHLRQRQGTVPEVVAGDEATDR